MAGAGYKLFTTGSVLTAAEVNTYLQEQVVMRFANSAARTSALSGVLAEGMVSYLDDTNVVEIYNGSAWASLDDPNAIQNTIVDAKGDLVAASADNVPARLAVGSNGETLVADSSTSTGLRYREDYAAGKNKIINGDFGIWQRGTSFTINATNIYTADRFFSSYSTAAPTTFTVSQQSFTPAELLGNAIEGTFYLRSALTSIGTATDVRLEQRIENVRTFASSTITVSFYAKADAARIVTILPVQNFGSGGSATVNAASSQTVTLTTSWARYSVTFAIASITGKTIGAGSYLGLRLIHPNSNSTIDYWGVQAEAGSVATAFQTATGTLAGELAAAMRYYQKSYNQSVAPATITDVGSIGMFTQATVSYNYMPSVGFGVRMRATPTITLYSSVTGTSAKIRNVGGGSDVAALVANTGESGFTAFVNNVSIAGSNELRCHWIAEIEL